MEQLQKVLIKPQNDMEELAATLYWLAKLKKSSMALLFKSIRPKNTSTNTADKKMMQHVQIHKLMNMSPFADIPINVMKTNLVNPHLEAYQQLKNQITCLEERYTQFPAPIFNATLLLIYESIKQYEQKEIKRSRQARHSSFHQTRRQQIQSINKLIHSFGDELDINHTVFSCVYQLEQFETTSAALAAMYSIRKSMITFLRNNIAAKRKEFPKYIWRIESITPKHINFSLHLLSQSTLNLDNFMAEFKTKFKNYQEKKQSKQTYWSQLLCKQDNCNAQLYSKQEIRQLLQPSWIMLCYDEYHGKETFGAGSLKRKTTPSN